MSLNDCTVLVFAVSFHLHLCSVPVCLTTFSQIRRLCDFEWGAFASVFNWDMAECGCGLFFGAYQKYSWRKVGEQRNISVKKQARGQKSNRNYLHRNRPAATFCFSCTNIRFLKNRTRFMRPPDPAYSSWLINRAICLSFCIVSLLISNRRAKLLRFRYALLKIQGMPCRLHCACVWVPMRIARHGIRVVAVHLFAILRTSQVA